MKIKINMKNGLMLMLFMQIGMLSNLAFAQLSNRLNSKGIKNWCSPTISVC